MLLRQKFLAKIEHLSIYKLVTKTKFQVISNKIAADNFKVFEYSNVSLSGVWFSHI